MKTKTAAYLSFVLVLSGIVLTFAEQHGWIGVLGGSMLGLGLVVALFGHRSPNE